jgi:flagellar FliL protein
MSEKKPESGKPDPVSKDEAAKGNAGPGWKSWLPLIVTFVLMPVMAFATTKFWIIPKVVQAREASTANGSHPEAQSGSGEDGGPNSRAKDGKESDGKTPAKKKQSFPISKVIVNVAGSMGTRYLMTSFTLVGTANDFKTTIEDNKDQILDVANTAMASKTITDLEKPGARNQLRSELITVINNTLGGNLVQEIYFTEFAVQ